jgi:hypothetical protein
MEEIYETNEIEEIKKELDYNKLIEELKISNNILKKEVENAHISYKLSKEKVLNNKIDGLDLFSKHIQDSIYSSAFEKSFDLMNREVKIFEKKLRITKPSDEEVKLDMFLNTLIDQQIDSELSTNLWNSDLKKELNNQRIKRLHNNIELVNNTNNYDVKDDINKINTNILTTKNKFNNCLSIEEEKMKIALNTKLQNLLNKNNTNSLSSLKEIEEIASLLLVENKHRQFQLQEIIKKRIDDLLHNMVFIIFIIKFILFSILSFIC